MRNNTIIFILLAAAVIIGGYLILRRNNTPSVSDTPLPTPSVTERIESVFGTTIDASVEKAELTGKDDQSAIATRDASEDKRIASYTVLADLKAPTEGYYQAWLTNEDNEYIKANRLTQAKGGWTMQFETSEDLSQYNRVIISQETTSVNEPTQVVLQGSFE